MITRRGFLRFLGIAPFAAPAVVSALSAPVASAAVPSCWDTLEMVESHYGLDALNVATMRHIKHSTLLVDNIFLELPTMPGVKLPGGRLIADNLTYER